MYAYQLNSDNLLDRAIEYMNVHTHVFKNFTWYCTISVLLTASLFSASSNSFNLLSSYCCS